MRFDVCRLAAQMSRARPGDDRIYGCAECRDELRTIPLLIAVFFIGLRKLTSNLIVRSSLLILFGLEALDKTGAVTPLGRKMSHFPLSPTLSRALLASSSPDLACTSELITVLSVLSATSKLLHEPPSSNSDARDAVVEMRAKFKHATGDHLMILNVVNAHDQIRAQSGVGGAKEWCNKHFVNERALKEAGEIAKQLKRSCASVGIDPEASCGDQSEKVLRCLLRGFFQHTAIIQPDGTYRQTFGRMVSILFAICPTEELTLYTRSSRSRYILRRHYLCARCPGSCTTNWCVFS